MQLIIRRKVKINFLIACLLFFSIIHELNHTILLLISNPHEHDMHLQIKLKKQLIAVLKGGNILP